MLKKITIGASVTLFALVIAYYGVVFHLLTSADISEAIAHSYSKTAINVIPKSLPEWYLFNYRFSEQDIKDINELGLLPGFATIEDKPTPKLERYLSYMVSKGADINQRDPVGLTALGSAALLGLDETIHMLLEHGADPSIRMGKKINEESTWWDGMTPLQVAVEYRGGLRKKGKIKLDQYDKVIEILKR